MSLFQQPTKKQSKQRRKIKPQRGGKQRKQTTQKNKSKTFQKAQCAPNPDKNQVLPFTCYTTDALSKMRDLWNARHPDEKITSNEPREIWNYFKEVFADVCDSEMCWLNDHFSKYKLDSEIMNYTFAPKSPSSWKKKPNEWLSSLDIMNVMKQYEKRYHCFEFIGPSPIDFDTHIMYGECVWEELCKFNIETYLKKEKYKIGVIFNLDPHYKGGSHWVSLFINIRKKCIYYFDSYGQKPEKEIETFVNRVISQASKLGIEMKYEYNKKRHQYSNSECGMYSLYFIIENLKDTPIQDLFEKRVEDKKMLELRNIYFNSG